ncbi:MAG: hypothetical protein HYW52_01065 [Gemmatimonadetes bacterium]|nr:hypothetical protein [Gemmatimonadota bacterium]
MRLARRLFLTTSALASLVLLTGCDIFGGGHTGTYTLKTVNGASLPAVIVQVGTTYKLEITAGSATLNEDNTFSASITFQETQATQTGTQTQTTTENESGTYTKSGNTITFSSSGATGPSYTGALSGGTLTITTEEEDVVVVLIFEK